MERDRGRERVLELLIVDDLGECRDINKDVYTLQNIFAVQYTISTPSDVTRIHKIILQNVYAHEKVTCECIMYLT